MTQEEALLEAVFEAPLEARAELSQEAFNRVITAVYADLAARGELGDQGQASHR